MFLVAVFALLCSVNIASGSGLAPFLELNNGHKIPVVALGTGRGTAKQNESNEVVRQAVFDAIEAGYRHIDTAAVYGDEKEVGQGIADAIAKGLVDREELFVTTKLWNDKHKKEDVVAALEESLSKLGLFYVDLFLIHFPIAMKSDRLPDYIDYLETWEGMEHAYISGLAKSIGVSNFNETQLQRLFQNAKTVKPAVNQIEVNPTYTNEPLVNLCKELNVAVMAYSPFGFMVTRNDPTAPPPKADDPVLMKIADKYKKSTTQVVLRYLVDRGLIPIPKSTNKERIADNIDIFDFRLTDKEVKKISKFNKNFKVIRAKDWKEYPNYPFGDVLSF